MVEEIDQYLFKRLEIEKKARFNWRKVNLMINLVRALSVRESDNLKNKMKDINDEE